MIVKTLFLLFSILCLSVVRTQDDDEEAGDGPELGEAAAFSGITLKDFNMELNKTPTPQIKINSITPDRGPTYGETRVLVRVGPLSRWEDLYPDPIVSLLSLLSCTVQIW
jgi:hypothetical protein